jgi:hypothetical protein
MSVNPKHRKYLNTCIPGEEYWGIGIENETYIEMSEGIQVSADFILKNKKRDRYCVNYWTQYKPGIVEKALESWVSELPQGAETPIRLALLLNGHTFTKCDQWGEHKTTYETVPRVNPKCGKRTLLEELAVQEPEIFGEDVYDTWWTFDGDTVEFMTRGFYCAKMEDVIEELLAAKTRWLEGLKTGLEKLNKREKILRQVPRWPLHNYGLAVFASNRRNIAIFNNGTYHFNFTLPTTLDKEGNIADWSGFVRKHQMAARMFQWLAPFLIAKWGSPDCFANLTKDPKINRQFPAGSQRLAASRYVSLGTFNTQDMPTGKQLLESTETLKYDSWRRQMYENPACAYIPLEMIGFDINFHKFTNHGLEFRIFDWFSEKDLPEVMRMLVWMLDASLECKKISVPQKSEIWNSVTKKAIWEGSSAILTEEECRRFGSVLGIHFPISSFGTISILDAYSIIWEKWANIYNTKKGGCSEKMLRTRLFRPIYPKLSIYSEKVPRKHTTALTSIVRLKSPSFFFGVSNMPSQPLKKLNKQTQTVEIVEFKRCCLGFFGKSEKVKLIY